MGEHLKPTNRAQAVAYIKSEKTYREIQKNFKVSVSTICRTLKKYEKPWRFEHDRNNKRSVKIKPQIVKIVLKQQKKNTKLSLWNRVDELKTKKNIDLSITSIKKILNESEVVSRHIINKSLLTKKHIEKRLELSKKFLFMSQSQRDRIVFSDESRFCLNRNDSKGNIWIKNQKSHSALLMRLKSFLSQLWSGVVFLKWELGVSCL
ncbi:hypothetical protein CDIK_4032 [Cucumispora dikerogammari]|nr:hypothetical protein CDIK_4032 [Cucumispora dikerogammari]